MAICRYFAKQVGLAGDNTKEELLIDMAVDTLTDYRLRKNFFDLLFCENINLSCFRTCKLFLRLK